ncbi:type II CRISPR-associated endonuclease Cas1 [Macellibacteroides fermentans]|uniref:type II CRISPR-associated endonuclease Cas1 n=1 Tax=Macellibacteroides fermentans TaxID=879969 RepID=UPI00406C5389
MFRTVIINEGEYISVKENWLVVRVAEVENKIPIDDIYTVVVDNRMTAMTASAVNALTGSGAHVMICNEKHMPASVIYPLNNHYRPLNVIRKQLAMPNDFKDELWKIIIQGKLDNQARVLKLCHVKEERIERLFQLKENVQPGDAGNCEGVGAKWFFRSLYGSEFIRTNDDAINAALNYGYAIIRSAIGKTLTAYGYNCVLGIHHINETNPFNLADDMMEPLRPLVDFWVDQNHEDLLNELTKENRRDLINLINGLVQFDNKKMKVRYAIDRYISSLTSAVEKLNAKLLKIPLIIDNDVFFEEEGDD